MNFDKFCSDVGLSMTSAICLFVKRTVKEQKIPFEIMANPFYSDKNIKRLEKAIIELNNGKSKKHEIVEK